MIALLAAAENAPLQLPNSYQGITVIALGGLIMCALTAGVVLAGFQRLRSALASEMKRELETTAKALSVQVQSPLTVQEHAAFVPLKVYQADQKVVDDRLNAATQSRKAIHKDVEAHSQRLASLEATRDHDRQVFASIDGKLTVILQRLPRQQ